MSLNTTTRFGRGLANVLIGAACLGGALGGCSKQITDRDIKSISLADVRALTESGRPGAVLMVDPRSPAAFAQGHIPGARNMQLDEVKADRGTDPALERYGTLVVYGEDPGTGSAVAMTKRLMMTGYKSVRWFTGGLSEWRRAGLTVEGGTAAAP